mgnify:CR=1 FL=1
MLWCAVAAESGDSDDSEARAAAAAARREPLPALEDTGDGWEAEGPDEVERVLGHRFGTEARGNCALGSAFGSVLPSEHGAGSMAACWAAHCMVLAVQSDMVQSTSRCDSVSTDGLHAYTCMLTSVCASTRMHWHTAQLDMLMDMFTYQ